MFNKEVDVQELVRVGLVNLKEREYIRGVTGSQVHSTGSGASFWVNIEEFTEEAFGKAVK